MKICVRPEAGSRENRARDIAAADGMMARESHATPLLCREVVRENRVNQSGSVALSTEAMPRAAGVAILLIKWRCRSTVQLRTKSS